VLSIYGYFPDGPRQSLLAGYDIDGRLDRRFGRGGTIDFDPPGVKPVAYALGSTPHGGLTAVSTAQPPPERLAVVRLRLNGHLDRSYGVGGVAFGAQVPSLGLGFDTGLAMEYLGSAVVATRSSANPLAFTVTRFTAEGALDKEFGEGGQTAPLFGAGRISVTVRLGGNILAAAFEGNAPYRELVYRFGQGGGLLSTVAVRG
jgi:hypothetical protein